MEPVFDLEIRTRRFAASVFDFARDLPNTVVNREIVKQLVRAAGSVGANYIEARESLGQKDHLLRLRTARKEAKEAQYWLGLAHSSPDQEPLRSELVSESTELLRILSAIIRNTEAKNKRKN